MIRKVAQLEMLKSTTTVLERSASREHPHSNPQSSLDEFVLRAFFSMFFLYI